MFAMRIPCLLLLAAIAVTGCTTSKTTTVVIDETVTKPELKLPKVQPVKLKRVTYYTVTEKNVVDVFRRAKAEGGVLIAVNVQGYKDIKLNEAQLLRLVRQQRAVIVAYERYYATEKAPGKGK